MNRRRRKDHGNLIAFAIGAILILLLLLVYFS
ncbi:hypothetical protein C8N47_107184 [Mangrovibacterium marinum]|uniref:Uncharacterized protein n=1 Tax=Mangrovibacterium marinum TaxID=1639118 RepID=A0A2T5C2A2_9BACT|nr:hypothetical protein C8N47_107184 [Mangrovibacterium marinum]